VAQRLDCTNLYNIADLASASASWQEQLWIKAKDASRNWGMWKRKRAAPVAVGGRIVIRLLLLLLIADVGLIVCVPVPLLSPGGIFLWGTAILLIGAIIELSGLEKRK